MVLTQAAIPVVMLGTFALMRLFGRARLASGGTALAGFGLIFVGIGLLQGRSYLAWVMSDFLPMRDEGWMILTRRLAACFGLLALARLRTGDAWGARAR